jgi:sulfate permease, SulP family
VPSIDATGLQVLEDVLARTRREGGTLLLTGVAEQPLRAMEQAGLLDKLGRENVLDNIDVALERANAWLNRPPA